MSTANPEKVLSKTHIPFFDFWDNMHASGGHYWTWNVNHPIGASIAYFAYRLDLKPNHISVISLLLSLFASFLLYFLPSGLATNLFIVIVFQLGYSFDCADGQLARATQQGSNFGKWLDVAIDLASALSVPVFLTAYAIFKLDVTFPLFYAFWGFLLAYSRASSLITSTLKRQAGGTIHKDVNIYRKVFRLITDTGFFLTVIPFVRSHQYALLMFLVVYSLLFLAHSFHLAKNLDDI